MPPNNALEWTALRAAAAARTLYRNIDRMTILIGRELESRAQKFLASNDLPHEWREVPSRFSGDRTDLVC